MDGEFITDYRAAARAMLAKNIPATIVVDRLQERGADPADAYRIAFSQKILYCQEQKQLAASALGLGLFILAGGITVFAVVRLPRTGLAICFAGASTAIGGYFGLEYAGDQMRLAKKRLAVAPN